MKRWLRRIRGAVLMGLTWAVLWAPLGLLIGMIVDPDGAMDEPWIAVGAYPGFLGGVAFATVLGIVARRRRFAELSIPRFARWGAAAGLLVGGLWVVVAVASDPPRWGLHALVVGAVTALTSASAAGSLALARAAQRRDGTGTEPDVGEAALAEDEGPARLESGVDPSTWHRPAAEREIARPIGRR